VRQSKKRRDSEGRVTTTSIEVQEAACRRVIRQLDSSPAGIEVAIDHGISGGAGQKRPGRDRMLELVDAGLVDAVIAYKADRIGRDIEESEHLWNRCVAKGVDVFATDCLDLSDPIYRAVYFGRAQKDIEDRSDYAQEMLNRRRRDGKPPTKSASAYGMEWRGDIPVPKASEWAVVTEILERFDAGESMGEIARSLQRRKLRRRNGSYMWDAAMVSSILYCTWYVGLVPDGLRPDGTQRYWEFGEQYVDPILWQRIQKRLERNKRERLHKTYSLSGLLFCGICESWSPMTLCYCKKTRKDGSVLIRPRFRCKVGAEHKDLCTGQSIDSERAEQLLLPSFAALLNTDEMAERRFARRAMQEAERTDEQLRTLADRIQRIEYTRAQLLDKWLAGLVPETLYDQRMVQLTAQFDQATAQRNHLTEAVTLSADALRRLRQEFADNGPLTEPNWFAKPAGRRNDFLRLAFPHGLFVLPSPQGTKPGDVTGRLALRHARDAANAETRRTEMRTPDMALTG
jgi:DNA invertase Pin-like site-specific DNA recombinase